MKRFGKYIANNKLIRVIILLAIFSSMSSLLGFKLTVISLLVSIFD